MSETTNAPSHIAYCVKDLPPRDGEEPKAHWKAVGAGWTHKDGKGINVTLDAIPVSGRLVIRERDEKDADSTE